MHLPRRGTKSLTASNPHSDFVIRVIPMQDPKYTSLLYLVNLIGHCEALELI